MSGVPLTKSREWRALEEHYQQIRHLHLRDLFATDPKRGERLTAEAVGLYLDYSKHRITDDTLGLLVQLAEASGLRARIQSPPPLSSRSFKSPCFSMASARDRKGRSVTSFHRMASFPFGARLSLAWRTVRVRG